MLLFFYAQILSQNIIFYYLCGITMGIACSFLILIYLIGRLIPNVRTFNSISQLHYYFLYLFKFLFQKSIMYSVSISGWTLSYFFLQYLLDNAKLILLQYKQYVFGYIVASGIVSFAFCYRFGPLTNPKTRNLIKWALQVCSI